MTPIEPVLSIPIQLPHVSVGKNQPEYKALHALISTDANGCVTTRWRLSWKERVQIMLFGNIWHQQLCFHGTVQPIKMLTVEPPVEECL